MSYNLHLLYRIAFNFLLDRKNMKTKGEKIALIVAIVVIILVIVGVVFGIRAVVKNVKLTKDALSIKEFTSIMKDNNFDVVDVTYQFAGANIDVKEARVAKKGKYQIEFYTFDDESSAKSFYRVNKAKFEEDTAKSKTDIKGRNYESYTATTKSKYKFIIQVEKSVVYVNVDKDYKDDVKDIIKELGY